MAATRQNQVAVKGSERPPVAEAREVGAAPADRRIEVTVITRSRADDALEALVDEGEGKVGRPPISREELAKRQGASPEDLERIEDFAHEHGLDVVQTSVARRTVVLAGTIADMSAAFGVDLNLYEHPDLGLFRGRTGPVYVPKELAGIVEAVLGLDDRPQARPHMRRLISDGPLAPHAGARSLRANEVAQLYDFPEGHDGGGQTVAIIELGGGYKRQDLATYFKALGVSPRPRVSSVSVDGAGNVPDGPDGADGEVMLDIEVVGAVAPGARLIVYFAPNTTAGFLDAITTAVHDRYRKPSVISISWGMAEEQWTPQALLAFDRAFKEAAALGVTVCCAAGDDGSSDNVNDGRAHVDFPASSPWVLACGGTRLESSGGEITNEEVWNEQPRGGGATGGGVSEFFKRPRYQQKVKVPPSANGEKKEKGKTTPKHRGVPDVAGDADPVTGYEVRVDGIDMVIGGTSAVAPLYAGLVALMNEDLGRPLGFLNPTIYQKAVAGAFHDITEGNNGDYRAGPGWDACTGLGTPDGADILSQVSQ